MLELAFLAVVVIDGVEQVGIIVIPLLERILLAEHARIDVAGDECRLDQECSRAAHRVDQIALAIPTAQADDACCQHLVDGRIGLCLTPSALVERLATRVERQSHLVAIDVHVQAYVGVGYADAGATALMVHKIVGYGVLDAIGDKAGVLELFAVGGRVDSKCLADFHHRCPFVALDLLVEVIGIGRAEFVKRFQHTQRGAQAEVSTIHQLLVALKRHHAYAFQNILGTQLAQLVG